MSVKVPNKYIADISSLCDAILALSQGQSNATGFVTLAASATSTTVQFAPATPQSIILISPMSANAAAVGATTYVSSISKGSFTLSHISDITTDRKFGFVCLT